MTESRRHDPESAAPERSEAHASSAESAPTQNVQTFLTEFHRLGMTSQKYIVEEQLAEGGMGVIYKVFDRGLQRHAVLKASLPELLNDQTLLGHFLQEAQLTGQLEHPNIIPVHDIGVTDDERPFFSMKFMQGEALIQIIGKLYAKDPVYEETYSLFKLLTIFRKVCDAVAFAHAKNVIHRDIKPDNIMVGEYGEVLLLDWGIAREAGGPEVVPATPSDAPQERSSLSVATDRTQFGEIKGTPAYMAPEQAMGLTDLIDQRTDIFLLGATLYTMVTLNMPYSGRDVYAILEQAEKGRLIPPQRRAPQRHIPEALNHIIMKCMAFDRDQRYPSVAELITDLDAFMAGEVVTQHRRFAKDAVLMREGEEGHEAYVVLSGAVEVSKAVAGQSVSLRQLGPGDTVGEMALISDAPRSATVTALADTEVVVINAELMQQALQKLPPWMGQSVRALANRLRESNAHVHPLMQRDCSWHALHQLQMMYPLYAQILMTSQENRLVMALPYLETMRDIALNLSLHTLLIDRIMQCLCQHGMLRMINSTHFTIVNYELFCQFVDFIREQMNYAVHLQADRKVRFHDDTTETASPSLPLDDATPGEADSPEDTRTSFRTLFEALNNEVQRGMATLAPHPGS